MPPDDQIQIGSRSWQRILGHELFEYLINFALLSFFLVSFAWYRRLLLASYHIDYFDYGAPLIEAAILAKIIMIGDVLHLGRLVRNRPLAVTTIYRTVVFSILVMLFSVAERVVGALIHGKTVSDGIDEITSKGADAILAHCVLIIAAFLPFFTVKEIERVIGEHTVRTMFFRKHADGLQYSLESKREAAKAMR